MFRGSISLNSCCLGKQQQRRAVPCLQASWRYLVGQYEKQDPVLDIHWSAVFIPAPLKWSSALPKPVGQPGAYMQHIHQNIWQLRFVIYHSQEERDLHTPSIETIIVERDIKITTKPIYADNKPIKCQCNRVSGSSWVTNTTARLPLLCHMY